MNQINKAQKGKITSEMEFILNREDISKEELIENISEGKIVILSNNSRKPTMPCAVGNKLTTKINANLGLSTDESDVTNELRKLDLCFQLNVDAVMDLSLSDKLFELRQKILDRSQISVGTVPVYELFFKGNNNINNIANISSDDFLDIVKCHVKEGVDFLTIHSGITKDTIAILKDKSRILDIVSRGGAIIAKWMDETGKENPFYERFDDIISIAREYDVTLSLGDGLRPGSILDATDKAQIAELNILGNLSKRAYEKGVQVIIEGPGHVPLNQIKENIKLQKEICRGLPFYVLGPLTTDIAAGYDHISAAIGGALAAYYGADFICYVTPAEHLRLPTLEDVREGIIAAKIAAHSADIAKGIKSCIAKDKNISLARREHDWESQIKYSIDPETSRKIREKSSPKIKDVCTMCSEFCALKIGKISS